MFLDNVPPFSMSTFSWREAALLPCSDATLCAMTDQSLGCRTWRRWGVRAYEDLLYFGPLGPDER